MLETVIAEKSLPRPNVTSGPSTLTRSNTLTANQRLKGLLSGKSSSFDKPMPIPTDTDSPPHVPPSADKPRSPALPATANNAHDHNMDRDRSANESQVSLGLSLPPPIQKPIGLPDQAGTVAGFKQVELPSSNARLETPHPEGK
jgi:vacuolar protein sorting-associated protein 54